MYVIDVIPLSRTAPGVLSYRSKEKRPPGTIVSIQLRKKATQGIVVSSLPVQDAKEMLKNARFLLSKSAPEALGTIPPEIMQAAEETAEHHATSIGAVLSAVFSEYAKLEIELPTLECISGSGYKRMPLEAPLHDRVEVYRKHIDEARVHGSSVLLVAPTLPELMLWKDTFSEYTPLILSGSLTGVKRKKAIAAAATHQGLVITTPAFSWIPIARLGMICVDRVSAGTYTLPQRPYLGMVYALEALARSRSVPFCLGDFPLPIEFRPKPDMAPAQSLPAPLTLIDARRNPDAPEEGSWQSVPGAVQTQIAAGIAAGRPVVVLATRKGYSPAVVCRDCGQAQTDDRGVPLTFSTAGGKRVFISSDGLSVLPTKRVCSRCESWNLLPLGIGVERIEEELRKAFPDTHISVPPSEATLSPAKAKSLITEGCVPGSILIATEALLPWLYAYGVKDALGVIASADSLLSLPFWRARERFVRLACFFAGVCSELILVTRRPEDTAVSSLTHLPSGEFWKEETQLRKALGYPPFGTILTLSVEGAAGPVSRMAARISEELLKFAPAVLAPRSVKGAVVRSSIVLLLPDAAWPSRELGTYIRELPPSVRVRIDPESF